MRDNPGQWVVVVHGGAKTIARVLHDRHRAGCARAAQAAAACLDSGGNAVSAVQAAIRMLEDDPTFNAGYGSVLNCEGAVEMDAALMDGADLAVGAVTCVSRLRNPVLAAAAMLRESPVLLAGEGAERFARDHGIRLCSPSDMVAPDAAVAGEGAGHDTVGCIVIDREGHTAAGTSTGGLPGKLKGRIGDSPLPGCGLQADDRLGAVALSGDGESIIRATLAAHAMHRLERSGAGAAARGALERLARVGGEAGVIVLDRDGHVGIAHNSVNFAVAVHASWLAEPAAAVTSIELTELLDD